MNLLTFHLLFVDSSAVLCSYITGVVERGGLRLEESKLVEMSWCDHKNLLDATKPVTAYLWLVFFASKGSLASLRISAHAPGYEQYGNYLGLAGM